MATPNDPEAEALFALVGSRYGERLTAVGHRPDQVGGGPPEAAGGLKAVYDPTNLFRINANIDPGVG